jgi:carbon monoxide dehydrogenase subunit G
VPRSEAKFAVNARPEELWQFLRDFESLCACIPGVERVRVVDARTVELTVKEKVGVVPLTVDLTARIESEEPPRCLRAMAKAEHLTMAIEVALEPAGAGTELASVFDVEGEGPLKPVVDRLFEKRAAERAAQFAETLARRFGAAAPPGAAGAVSGDAAPGWLARLRRWLARLWRRQGTEV